MEKKLDNVLRVTNLGPGILGVSEEFLWAAGTRQVILHNL
jgi:hypothetical protein